LSVAPSRLDEVRAAIQAASLAEAVALADVALRLDSAAAVLALFDAGTGDGQTPAR
jgi:hypothetical protein